MAVSCVGKRLTRLGMYFKIATGALMSLGCLMLLTGAVPYMTACYGIVAVALASIVSDFANAAD